MDQRFPNLANVIISILESKIELIIGKGTIKELKLPYEKEKIKEELANITAKAESRLVVNPEIKDALRDLPIADIPSVTNSILAFYENPTNPDTIKEIELQIRNILPIGYSEDEIVHAAREYLFYVWEGMAFFSLPDIREKIIAISAIRTEKNTEEMTKLLRSINNKIKPISEIKEYFDFKIGIQLLKNKIIQSRFDNSCLIDLLTLEARLLTNLNDERHFGVSNLILTDRANIVKELEKLSLQTNTDFNELCQGNISKIDSYSEEPGISPTELELLYSAGQELEQAGFLSEAESKYWRIWQIHPEYSNVAKKLKALENQSSAIFVNRESELNKFADLLEKSLMGTLSVVLLSGEAGTGKTFLVQEFLRRAQTQYADLIYATGTCNAQYGVGQPFQPFKEILSLLCGDIEEQLAQANISITNAHRLFQAAPLTLQYLPAIAPNLLNTIVPSALFAIKQKEFKVQNNNFRQRASVPTFETAISAFANSTQSIINTETLFVLRKISEKFPLVIFIDDLQWGDTASVDLLYYLATRLIGARIMLIGSFRSSDIASTQSSVPKFIRDLRVRHNHIYEIDLDKPNEYFVKQYITQKYSPNHFSSKFITKIQTHTGGNALFASELFQYLEDTNTITKGTDEVWNVNKTFDFRVIPTRVENIIEQRIEGLEGDLREILGAASVEGEEFTAQVLVNLFGLEERKLLEQLSNELEQKWHLVAVARTVTHQKRRLYLYRFRHALVRLYIYSKLSVNERELLHRDIGLLLETMYETNPRPICSSLAEHFSIAGLPEKESKYRLIAAQEAAKIGAKEVALYHLNRIESLLNEISQECKPEVSKQLYSLRGNIYALTPNTEKAKNDFAELEKASAFDNDQDGLIQALCGYSILERSLGNFETALEFVSRAEAIVSNQATELFADCKLLKAKIFRDLGFYERVGEEANIALIEYEKIHKDFGILDARSQIAYVYYAQGNYQEAEALFSENLFRFPELANLPQDPDDDVYYELGFVNWRLGRYKKAKEFLTKALESAQQVNNLRKQAYCLNNLGFVETSLGDYEKAENILKYALTFFVSIAFHSLIF